MNGLGLAELLGFGLIAGIAVVASSGRPPRSPSPCAGCGCQLCGCSGQVSAVATGSTCPAGCGCTVVTGADGSVTPVAVRL
jgi:hypothetical protein